MPYAILQSVAPHQVYRLGGDEFAIPLVQTSLDEAHALGGLILAAMPEGVTLSCGVAEVIPGARTADLLRAADQALYVAKRSGRARVCAASASAQWAWPERSPDAPRERRRRRRRPVDIGQLLDRTLDALDASLSGSSVLARLEAVVALTAESLGLARAAVSCAAAGTIVELITMDFRSGRTWAREFGLPGQTFKVADSPETDRILRAGGSFSFDRASVTADPAEVALLEH